MKHSIKTIQGNLKPNQETKQQLQFISRGCAFVYNHFLNQRIERDKNKQKQPTWQKQQKDLTRLKKKEKWEWLNKICASILNKTIKNKILVSWNNFEEYRKINPKANYPRLKTDKGWHDSFEVGKQGYKIENSQLTLSQGRYKKKRQSKIIIPFELNQPLEGKMKTLTISFKGDNWAVGFVVEKECPPRMLKSEIRTINGIDRNVRKLFANSDGWKFKNPKYWEKKLKRIKEFQQSLSRKKHKRFKDDPTEPSKNYLKTKAELKGLCERVSNRVKDRNHKLTRKWVDRNDAIIFEKLKEMEMVKKKDAKGKKRKIGKWTTDAMLKTCWRQQANFTTYKAMGAGKWIEFVSPRNTSRMCYECKEINYELGSDEMFVCPIPFCGNQDDRDVNAAKNIRWKGIKKLRLGIT